MAGSRQGVDGKARVLFAERRQIEFRWMSHDQMLPLDDPARAVLAYVEALDLGEFYAKIRAVEGRVGRDAIDLQILLTLWLYATIDGVASARRLARNCQNQIPYQWICGSVSVNHHTLSDFRTDRGEAIDRLLTQSMTLLLAEGLIHLDRVAQDGMRVRASAGAGSFGKQPKLDEALAEAEAHLANLKKAAEDATADETRHHARREREVPERAERIQRALAARDQVALKMEERKKGSGTAARASTTDPDCRKMKMGDGGFRAAYNVQFATTTDSRVIVGVDVVNAGTDGGQLLPMVDQVINRFGIRPPHWLADGGFVKLLDITQREREGTQCYLPITELTQSVRRVSTRMLP